MKKKPFKKLILPIIFAGMIGFGGFHYLSTYGRVTTDDAAIEAHIVPLASKISGYVTELAIIDNQHVKKGDILLRIDPRDYQARLDNAKAQLQIAEARLIAGQHQLTSTSVSAPSNLESARSQLDAALARLKNARQTLDRLQKLSDAARSRQSLETAVATEKEARADVQAAQAQLKSAQTAPDTIAASKAYVQELEAAVTSSKAALTLAQNDVDDTILRAPQDGRITKKNVEVGAFIQTGQQLSTLVGDDLWVIANFKETQLAGMKPGQNVDIKIDAYKGPIFSGKVDSLQAGTGARFSLFPPENATGNFIKIVQRVPVKITFDEPSLLNYMLGPGMSVVPTVHIK